MKKVLVSVFSLMMSTAAAFSLPMGFGGGLQIYDNFISRKASLSGNYVWTDTGGATSRETITNSNFLGAHVFFDAAYVEADVGISWSSTDGKETDLNVSLLGKYPFTLGSVTLFPLLGVTYDMVLAKENTYGNKFGSTYNTWFFYKNGEATTDKVELADLNTLWIQLGFGSDIPLNSKIFLRGEYRLGIAPLNKYLKNVHEENYASSGHASYDYFINYIQAVQVSVGMKL